MQSPAQPLRDGVTDPLGVLVVQHRVAGARDLVELDVEPDAFEAAVREGLRQAGRQGRIVHRGAQPPDRPVRRSFPEGRYPKFLVLQLDD